MRDVATTNLLREDEEKGGPAAAAGPWREVWLRRHGPFILAVILVLTAGLSFRISSTMDRPLEFDEISPLSAYTSVGYISTIAELRAKKPFQIGETIRGIVRCFGTWRGPANNIFNNVGLSIYTFFFGFSERSLRGFAMLCSLMLALVMMYWIYRYCDSALMAAFGGFLLLAHPYFVRYGQMARGYAFSSMLIMIDIVAIEVIRKRKQTIWTVAFLAFLNYCIFLDMVSSVFVWLIPLYLCAIWGAGGGPSAAEAASGDHWIRRFFADRKRQGWILQAVCVSLMIGEFVLTHFRTFVGAQSKFGIPMQTQADAVANVKNLFHYLFPYTWVVAAALGVLGWGLMLPKRTRHWLAPVIIVSMFCLLVYAVGTRKLPYERTFGFYVILVVMGIAWVWKSFEKLNEAVRLPARAILALILLFIIGTSSYRAVLATPIVDYSQCAAVISEQIRNNNETPDGTLILMPYIYAQEMRIYLPENNRYLHMDAAKKQHLNVYVPCRQEGNRDAFRCQYFERKEVEFVYADLPNGWPGKKVYGEKGYSVYRVPMAVREGPPVPGLDNGPRVVIWTVTGGYFDLASYVSDYLKWYRPIWKVKFVANTFMHPRNLVFFTSGDADILALQKILANLDKQTYGRVHTLSPDPDAAQEKSAPTFTP